ncbi:hypothetical protein TYRP_006944, partial [Tyrophagus putrescentiae]
LINLTPDSDHVASLPVLPLSPLLLFLLEPSSGTPPAAPTVDRSFICRPYKLAAKSPLESIPLFEAVTLPDLFPITPSPSPLSPHHQQSVRLPGSSLGSLSLHALATGSPLEHLHSWSTFFSDSTRSSLAFGITTGGPSPREHLIALTTIDSTSSSSDLITTAGPPSREHLITLNTINSTSSSWTSSPSLDHHRGSTSSPSPPSTRLARVRTSSPSSREHLITLTTIDSTCSSLNLALRFAQRIKNLGRALRARPKKSKSASKMSTAAARRLTFLRKYSMTAASRPSLEIASGDFKEDLSPSPLQPSRRRSAPAARALRARALRIQQIF